MKKITKKLCVFSMIALMIFTFAGCGKTQFNSIGITMGNLLNGGQVTYQGNSIYYIYDGDIYKTDDIEKEGKVIYEGDVSWINVKGENIYFYDNSISTICKANSLGYSIDRIAEIYCYDFVVNKDNIYAMILTGSGSDDLEDPDNYKVVRMKVTDKKLTSKTAKSVVENGKLIGSIGDYLYIEKNGENGTRTIYRTDLDGKNETLILKVNADCKVIGDSKGFVIMGTVDKTYGIFKYSLEGKYEKTLATVGKNTSVDYNAINMDSEYVYYENYTATNGTIADNIIQIKREDGTDPQVLATNAQNMEYQISTAGNGVLLRAKIAGNLQDDPKWIAIKK